MDYFHADRDRYGGDHRVRFPAPSNTGPWPSPSPTESLRDIETCLSVHASKLYHMGFRQPVRRSTLADANERRDWRNECYGRRTGVGRPIPSTPWTRRPSSSGGEDATCTDGATRALANRALLRRAYAYTPSAPSTSHRVIRTASIRKDGFYTRGLRAAPLQGPRVRQDAGPSPTGLTSRFRPPPSAALQKPRRWNSSSSGSSSRIVARTRRSTVERQIDHASLYTLTLSVRYTSRRDIANNQPMDSTRYVSTARCRHHSCSPDPVIAKPHRNSSRTTVREIETTYVRNHLWRRPFSAWLLLGDQLCVPLEHWLPVVRTWTIKQAIIRDGSLCYSATR